MFKRNKIYSAVAASALISLSAMSTAQESVTTTTQVEVSNSFTVALGDPLSFGTLAVIQNLDLTGGGSDTPIGAGDVSTYTVNATGTTSVAGGTATNSNNISKIVEITPGSPATYNISNAARFTEVFVTLNAGTLTFDVLPDAVVDAADSIALQGTLAMTNTLITAASRDVGVALPLGTGTNSADGVIRTDGTGTASFAVGATLATTVGARTYVNGSYSGTFGVTVNY